MYYPAIISNFQTMLVSREFKSFLGTLLTEQFENNHHWTLVTRLIFRNFSFLMYLRNRGHPWQWLSLTTLCRWVQGCSHGIRKPSLLFKDRSGEGKIWKDSEKLSYLRCCDMLRLLLQCLYMTSLSGNSGTKLPQSIRESQIAKTHRKGTNTLTWTNFLCPPVVQAGQGS